MFFVKNGKTAPFLLRGGEYFLNQSSFSADFKAAAT